LLVVLTGHDHQVNYVHLAVSVEVSAGIIAVKAAGNEDQVKDVHQTIAGNIMAGLSGSRENVHVDLIGILDGTGWGGVATNGRVIA
jgi:hypothetical protein